ncbi:MAG: SRPBCC family protein [Methyloceanibacter sp.]
MLKKILIAVALLILAFVVVVALQPSELKVERTAAIAAPSAEIFPHVNDFHNWEAWSPWAKLDPNAKIAFEGPDSGTGASMSWAGNDKVGEGKMTMIESAPDDHLNIKVDFVKPFEGSVDSAFGFKPDAIRPK